MLVKYLLPVVGLVALQICLNSWASAQVDGEKDDLDSAELFLRPVVIKYGHDHPGIYTWQGGSGVGQGWGMYKPKAEAGGGGWGKEKKKKAKKKKKKEKKKKKPKKKKKKKPKKKKKEKKKKMGWSWGPIEDGEGEIGSSGYGAVGAQEESSEEKKEERIGDIGPLVLGQGEPETVVLPSPAVPVVQSPVPVVKSPPVVVPVLKEPTPSSSPTLVAGGSRRLNSWNKTPQKKRDDDDGDEDEEDEEQDDDDGDEGDEDDGLMATRGRYFYDMPSTYYTTYY